jgi:hypothetical protein
VIGGLSAEMTLKTVKMASTKYLGSFEYLLHLFHSDSWFFLLDMTNELFPRYQSIIFQYLKDNLYTTGNADGRAFRDLALEKEIHALTQSVTARL